PDATEEHLDAPVIYASAKAGTASLSMDTPGEDLRPLFEEIIAHVPPPRGKVDGPLQILVANLDSSDYLGRIAVGRVFNGTVKVSNPVTVCKFDGTFHDTKITKLFAFDGLKRVEVDQAAAGDIVCIAGIENITIGETIADIEHREAIPGVARREPT